MTISIPKKIVPPAAKSKTPSPPKINLEHLEEPNEVSEFSEVMNDPEMLRSPIIIPSDTSYESDKLATPEKPKFESPHIQEIVRSASEILRIDSERLERANSWYNDRIINFLI